MEKLELAERFLSNRAFSQFIINSSNVTKGENGFAYSINFNSVRIYENPSCIMFNGEAGYLAINGIKDVSFEEHVLGILMKIVTMTDLCMTVICR